MSAAFEYETDAQSLDDLAELERVLKSMSEDDKLLLVAAYYHRIEISTLAEHFGVSRRTIDNRLHKALMRTRKALGIKTETDPDRREGSLPTGVYSIWRNGHRYVQSSVFKDGKKRYLGCRPATPEGIAELAEIFRKAKESR